MSQVFTFQLGLKIQRTNIEAQKIDNTTLETYEIVVSTFFVSDKDRREKFFEKSFLLADVNPDVVLGMLFLTMSNVDIDFQAGTYNKGLILSETYFQLQNKLN